MFGFASCVVFPVCVYAQPLHAGQGRLGLTGWVGGQARTDIAMRKHFAPVEFCLRLHWMRKRPPLPLCGCCSGWSGGAVWERSCLWCGGWAVFGFTSCVVFPVRVCAQACRVSRGRVAFAGGGGGPVRTYFAMGDRFAPVGFAKQIKNNPAIYKNKNPPN